MLLIMIISNLLTPISTIAEFLKCSIVCSCASFDLVVVDFECLLLDIHITCLMSLIGKLLLLRGCDIQLGFLLSLIHI